MQAEQCQGVLEDCYVVTVGMHGVRRKYVTQSVESLQLESAKHTGKSSLMTKADHRSKRTNRHSQGKLSFRLLGSR